MWENNFDSTYSSSVFNTSLSKICQKLWTVCSVCEVPTLYTMCIINQADRVTMCLQACVQCNILWYVNTQCFCTNTFVVFIFDMPNTKSSDNVFITMLIQTFFVYWLVLTSLNTNNIYGIQCYDQKNCNQNITHQHHVTYCWEII